MLDYHVRSLDYRYTPLRDSLFAILEDRQAVPEWLGVPGWNRAGLLAAAQRPAFIPRVMTDLCHQNPADEPAVKAALATAADGKAVFVITGQQAGFLGGPLYTVYKAITVLRLVNELQKENIPAVGLFWVAGEDHDLAEVSAATILGPGGRQQTFTLQPENGDMRPVSLVRLGKEIHSVLEELRRMTPDSAAGREFLAQVAEGVRPDMTFGRSFRRLMQRWFARFGLLFFDPMAADRRAMMADFLQPLADLRAEIPERVQSSSRRLVEHGFPAPVALQRERCCLFYLHPEQGRRRVLTSSDGRFAVDGTDIVWDEAGYRSALREEPECFSPDVLLRPLLQDAIFPTALYVGGPAEMAYQLQIRELYPLWRIPAPVLWPRITATLLGPSALRKLEKLDLTPDCLFEDKTTLTRNLLLKVGADQQLEEFRHAYAALESKLDDILLSLKHFPEPMIRSAESTIGKVQGLLSKLEERVQRQLKKDNEDLVGALAAVLEEVLPGGRMQERVFNVGSFLMFAGPALLPMMMQELDPFRVVHNLIEIAAWESDVMPE
ncbi:MAG: bacillithiol biosynthesis cysteine-adding enzyme BshC [Acidobacteria bacterium]|nr:bacillithiol biosynthesis cysteine-adding enzyme BshC [Acidobacteriota bacterium]